MGFLILILSGLLYFLPSVIACSNKKTNSASIFICNLFCFIVPVIGWVVCLAWSVAKEKPQDIVQVFNDNHPGTLGYVKRGE